MSVTYIDRSGRMLDGIEAAIMRALEIIGGMAETNAKYLCPKKTGRLQNSITHIVDEKEHAAVIGTNVEYAPYVELGTVRIKTPKPYLRPAIEGHIRDYQTVLEREIKRAAP